MQFFRRQFAAIVLIILSLFTFRVAEAYGEGLSAYYYRESCPLVEEIVRQVVEAEVYRDPFVAAQLLRLHFHDCFVLGCDASVLLDSTPSIISEKQAVPNLNSLRGFEVIDRIKAVIEEVCPLTVSCADIVAIAARDSVHLRGGPSWKVYLGRRDSLKASFSGANQFIPAPNFTLEMLVSNFQTQGLNIEDLVALSGSETSLALNRLVKSFLLHDIVQTIVVGSHTMGRSRCVSFKGKLYGAQFYEELEYFERNHIFRSTLRSICPKSGRDNDLVPLDLRTSRRFDNHYYLNVLEGTGLLQSDEELVSQDPQGAITRLVWTYASDQELFFRHFANSMIKMGSINVLTGTEGEIRQNCRYINGYKF